MTTAIIILFILGLASLITLRNPLDITPAADDETHVRIAEALVEDDAVDGVVIGLDPLSPSTRTLSGVGQSPYDMEAPDSIRRLMIDLVGRTDKPIVTGAWSGGVSKDPYLSVRFAGKKGDDVTVAWKDNKGDSDTISAKVG